jgi:hypothetical protein
MQRFNEKAFLEIARPPAKDKGEWLKQAGQSIEFLKLNARSGEIVIYGIAPAALIHGVLAPRTQVTPADHKDLLASYVMPDDSWRIERAWGGGQGHRIYLDPPLSSPGCKSLVGGEKLVFRRSFTGVDKGPAPVELSQKLIHSLDLYYVAERSAYCRLDRHGDIEDVIRVIWLKPASQEDRDVVVTILAADLARYATLADMCLVLKFDFTRCDKGFDGWDQNLWREHVEPDLFYNTGMAANASYANGCMIMRSIFTVDDLIQEWKDEDEPGKKEYATFKIVDRKNKNLVETSCAPEYLSNYFEKSDLPWEISPAFFKPEVLHRFKSDPEKYDLQDRSINCRGAWYLKSYDINQAGQVHAYIPGQQPADRVGDSEVLEARANLVRLPGQVIWALARVATTPPGLPPSVPSHWSPTSPLPSTSSKRQ